MSGKVLSPPQGSIDQGSIDQGSEDQEMRPLSGDAFWDAPLTKEEVDLFAKRRWKTSSRYYPNACNRLFLYEFSGYFRRQRGKNPSHQQFVHYFDELIERDGLSLDQMVSGVLFHVEQAKNLARQRKLVPTPPDPKRFFLGSERNEYESWVIEGLDELKSFEDARSSGRAVSVGGVEFPAEFDDYLDRLGA